MNTREFPGCCAATIIYNFGNTAASLERTKWPPEEIERQVLHAIRIEGHEAFLVAIINNDQMKVVAPVLKRCGFRSVAVGANTGHNSSQPCRLFVYTHKHHVYQRAVAATRRPRR